MINIVAGVFLILLGIIVIISVFIWIVSNIKISMNSKYNKISSIVIVVVVILFIIIFPILLKTTNIFENFDNEFPNNPPKFPNNPSNNTPPQNSNSSMQYGRSGNQPTGTITFKQPFQNTPKIMTQIIGNENTKTNIYSVQIYNVSNQGFSYSKNMMSNSTSDSGNFTLAKMTPSTIEPFDWIAFG